MVITLLIIVLIIAFAFEYINGFHDSANAIATVVATKVLSPRTAVIYGGILNFAGAFSGTHVAKTISSGILTVGNTPQMLILCALLGAIVWNLITWYYGLPSSSSHALIGGLLGAGVASYGLTAVNFSGVFNKVVIPMITSPIIGFLIGCSFMILLLRLFHRFNPDKINKKFRVLQLISSGVMAFSHGSNDAQKTMGIITLAVFSMGLIGSNDVPLWVLISCASVMGLGTMAGGWKIIKTIGSKVIRLKPIHGFAAETSAAAIILTASQFGLPVSTTHIISASIMGVGATFRPSAVRWNVVGNIIITWVLTIPSCMLLSGLIYSAIYYIGMIFN